MAHYPRPCPKRTERHRKKRQWLNAVRFGRYASPKYHVRKFLEDLRSARHALRMWRIDTATDEASLRVAMRGKLFATYLSSAMIAGLGPWIGFAIQAATGNLWIGAPSGILLANLLGLLGYQVVWAVTNRHFYAAKYGRFAQRWVAMLHDLWPMQWRSVQIVVVANLVLLPILFGSIWLFTATVPAHVSRFIPLPLVVTFAEFILLQGTLLRMLGDLFERHARVLARRYSPQPQEPIPD